MGMRPLDDDAIRLMEKNLPALRELDLSGPHPKPVGAILKRAGPTQHGTLTGVGFRVATLSSAFGDRLLWDR